MDMCHKKVADCLKAQRSELLRKRNWKRIDITTNGWASSQFEEKPAVYVFIDKKNSEIVYAGETGNLRKRMGQLRRTVNHNIRRNIGEKFFSNINNYSPASSTRKFEETIEKAVNDYLENNLLLSFLYIDYGRKELEEYLIKKDELINKLNKKGRSS